MKVTLKRWWVWTLVLSALLTVGCNRATLSPEGPYRGNMLLYRTDQTILSAKKIMSDFVTWEMNMHPYLAKMPEVTGAANHIRTNAFTWLSTADAARNAYANSPTEANAKLVDKTVMVLDWATMEAIRWMSKSRPIPVTNEAVLPFAPETSKSK